MDAGGSDVPDRRCNPLFRVCVFIVRDHADKLDFFIAERTFFCGAFIGFGSGRG